MSVATLRPLGNSLREMVLPDEAATVRLAEDLAAILAPGDLIALSGDLGAGKSTLSRALLRVIADDDDLEVPSPTFTLVQTYDLGRMSVSHFDLYRLEEPEELEELGLGELLETGAALIEWPEQGGDLLTEGALWLRLEAGGDDPDARICRFASDAPGWEARLDRTFRVRDLLGTAGMEQAHRRHLTGDASTRSYERIRMGTQDAVLMNWPRRPKGAAGSEAAMSYERQVHLATDCRPFVAIGEELRRRGFAAPAVFASDLDAGLLVLEDLGGGGIVENGRPIADRYGEAVRLLAEMHGQTWPVEAPLPDGSVHEVPRYTRQAMLTEADLYLDWYVPYATGSEATAELRNEYHGLWTAAFERISNAETGWVLRDYHSPNVIWRDTETGLARVGLIDYQDAVIGPVAYDVASILLDARVDIAEALERELFRIYIETRRAAHAGFDEEGFSAAYAVMGAQRIAKILGIFVRLDKRDGKPVYLNHLPRMRSYMDRVLAHPVLSDLKDWFETNQG